MESIRNYIIVGVIAIVSFFILLYTYFSLSYPIMYKEYVMKYADYVEIDPVMIYSVINVESSFRSNVVSEAGAVGLMQLQLSTANDMAKKCNDNLLKNQEELMDVELNIKYGCMYLRYLIDYYCNTETALAAYNAGLGNVNEWLQDKSYSEDGITIHTIPYKETRQYIERIKKNITIYNIYNNIGKFE